MHTVFALLCFVVVIHWLIIPYPSGLLHWHCGNLTIAPVPAKQPWWLWINTSCEFIMNDCITTTKQSTTKPCAYFLGYTVSYSLAVSTKRSWRRVRVNKSYDSNKTWWHCEMDTFSALLTPFVRAIHQSSMDSPHKGPVMQIEFWCFIWYTLEQMVQQAVRGVASDLKWHDAQVKLL